METRKDEPKAKAGTTEAAAPPPVVGYPDRSEVGYTEAEASANKAANDKVATANKEQADAAAKASAGVPPAPEPKAATDDDDDTASRRRR
jgi:hypothetical protein